MNVNVAPFRGYVNSIEGATVLGVTQHIKKMQVRADSTLMPRTASTYERWIFPLLLPKNMGASARSSAGTNADGADAKCDCRLFNLPRPDAF